MRWAKSVQPRTATRVILDVVFNGPFKYTDMEDTENKKTKSAKQALRERMSKKFPDRGFSVQDAQEGSDDSDALAQAIVDTLDEYDKYGSQLNDLFSTDVRSAEFINAWVNSGDPRSALIETFGDEFFDAAKSEEAKTKFKGQLEDWRKRKKAEDDTRAEYDANWTKSLEDLESWGNEKGLTQEQKVQVILKLADVSENAIRNVYTPESFEMAWNALRFNDAVNDAHQSGLVEGRNDKIAQTRKAKEEVGKLPPAVSGQGVRAAEPKPQRPRTPWAGIK